MRFDLTESTYLPKVVKIQVGDNASGFFISDTCISRYYLDLFWL